MISIMVRNREKLQKLAAVIIAVLVWQAAAMLIDRELLLASPAKVAVALSRLVFEGSFWSAVWFTFIRVIAGFLLAFVIGSALAVIAGRLRAAELLLWPFITAIKSVPVASFIVIALIWMKSDKLSVFMPFLMVLPIIYGNVLEGIRSTDVRLLEMAAIFRVPWRKRLRFIYLPGIRPFIRSACSFSLGTSWKAGIAAEIIGIPGGSIGERFYEAKVYLLTDELFAWTIVVVIISALFEKLFLKCLDLFFRRLVRS